MNVPEPLQDLGICPSGGSDEVNAIWYGMPTPDYKEHWPVNVGAGGCSISDDSPDRVCMHCGGGWDSADYAAEV